MALTTVASLGARSISIGTRVEEIAHESVGLQKMLETFRVYFLDRDPKTPPWGFWLDLWARAAHTPHLQEQHAGGVDRARHGYTRYMESAIAAGEVRNDLAEQIWA